MPSEPTSAKDEENAANLWNNILSEAASKNSSVFKTKNALFLGDRDSGKTTVLSYLARNMKQEIGKGLALDYSYIDVTADDEGDAIGRVNTWILEGDTSLRCLLRYALSVDSLADTAAVITLDFSQPWNLVESLNKWLNFLSDFVLNTVKPQNEERFAQNQKTFVHHFQQYKEPAKGTVAKKKNILQKQAEETDVVLLPLEGEVLKNNLGFPVVVVCCKSDATELLEKNYGYTDYHFDYIQQYIRRICLQYGASLVYCTGKTGKNCDLLFNYLQHLLFRFDFVDPANTTEKDGIFVPIGWDTEGKIKIDFDNQQLTNDPLLPYDEVIKKPAGLRTNLPTEEVELRAEDDQALFSTLFENMKKDIATPSKKQPGILSSIIGELISTPETEGESKMGVSTKTPLRQRSPSSSLHPLTTPPTSSSATSSMPSTPLPSSALGTPNEGTPATPSLTGGRARSETAEHQVLFNFFNHIINKDRTTGTGAAGPSLAAAGASAATRSPTTPLTNPGGSKALSSMDIEKELERLRKNRK